MDLSLVTRSATVILNGTGATAPLRGTRFLEGKSSGAELVLEVALDGTVTQITSWVESAERVLDLAPLSFGLPGEDVVYLQAVLDGVTWRTPIEEGWFEYASRGGAAVRGSGSQGLLLHVKRPDYWEDVNLSAVPLTNRNGTDQDSLTISNHSDSGDDNFVKISSAGVAGALPTPAWLRLVCLGTNGLTYHAGQAVTSSVTHTYMLEAESGTLGAGVTGAGSAVAGTSNGSYRPLSWSGSSAVMLLYWDLGAADTAKYAGRIFRPLLRLRTLVTAGEKFWLWWRVGYNVSGTIETVQDFEGVLCSTSQRLVACPPLPVPPWPKPDAGWGWESATVCLMCQAEAAGAHALELDFVQMLPTEGWVKLTPIVSTVADTKIVHDAGTGRVTRSATGMASHAPEGPGLVLVPGVAQTVFILANTSGGMDIATSTEVKIMYRRRRRAL
jgi:hypothetical protein